MQLQVQQVKQLQKMQQSLVAVAVERFGVKVTMAGVVLVLTVLFTSISWGWLKNEDCETERKQGTGNHS